MIAVLTLVQTTAVAMASACLGYVNVVLAISGLIAPKVCVQAMPLGHYSDGEPKKLSGLIVIFISCFSCSSWISLSGRSVPKSLQVHKIMLSIYC
jgi:hypothetical protein